MLPEVKADALKRLNYVSGHLDGIRRMVEQDKYCVDILKQPYAVRKAIEKLELLMLGSHMDTCVVPGSEFGQRKKGNPSGLPIGKRRASRLQKIWQRKKGNPKRGCPWLSSQAGKNKSVEHRKNLSRS